MVHVASALTSIRIDIDDFVCHSINHLGVRNMPRRGGYAVRDCNDDLICFGQTDAGEGGFLMARAIDNHITELVTQVRQHVLHLVRRDRCNIERVTAGVQFQNAQVRTCLRQGLSDITAVTDSSVQTFPLRDRRSEKRLQLTVVRTGNNTGHVT